MIAEQKELLQSIIDSIDSPAAIKEKNRVVLTNKAFESLDFGKCGVKKKIERQGYIVEEKDVSDDISVMTVKPDWQQKFDETKEALRKAIALL